MFARSNQSARFYRSLGGVALVAIIASACSAGGASSPPAGAPASASNATAQVMAKATFHDVDGTATGEVQLVVKPDGAYAVVLENFKIEAIAHTNIVLVSNVDVTATGDVDKSKLLDLGPLKATEGMQDFIVPADMASTVMEGYHTVVIWDTEMAHAIAAAPLK